MSNSTQNEPAPFSLGQARSLVKDLFQPNPVIYWADFLISYSVGLFCFVAISHGGTWFPGIPAWNIRIPAFVVCCLAFYRAALFTHEMVHMRTGSFRAFRATWNLLCGTPFLMPSFTYTIHIDHHRRKSYGTQEDGEYLPLGTKPPREILIYMLQPLFIAPLAVLRFGLVTPLSWISPRLRNWAAQHASSIVMDPTHIRPLPSARVRRVWRVQEAACFMFLAWVGLALYLGLLPAEFVPKAYLIAVGITTLNNLRTLAAHRYLSTKEEDEMTFTEQLLDSVNHPGNPLIGPLWAPVGLRFHALHHLFPSMPYHNLAEAHDRLMAGLPADSIYRLTVSHSLIATLRDLWADSKSVAEGRGVQAIPAPHYRALRHRQMAQRALEEQASRRAS